MVFCTSCGTKLPEPKPNFCFNCGESTGPSPTPASAPAPRSTPGPAVPPRASPVSRAGSGNKRVVVYTSASGGLLVQKYTNCMNNLVSTIIGQQPEVIYMDYDGTDKQMVWSKSGKKGVYPLLFCNDEYIGDWELVENLNEEGRLRPRIL